jgi:hypothetical protein
MKVQLSVHGCFVFWTVTQHVACWPSSTVPLQPPQPKVSDSVT